MVPDSPALRAETSLPSPPPPQTLPSLPSSPHTPVLGTGARIPEGGTTEGFPWEGAPRRCGTATGVDADCTVRDQATERGLPFLAPPPTPPCTTQGRGQGEPVPPAPAALSLLGALPSEGPARFSSCQKPLGSLKTGGRPGRGHVRSLDPEQEPNGPGHSPSNGWWTRCPRSSETTQATNGSFPQPQAPSRPRPTAQRAKQAPRPGQETPRRQPHDHAPPFPPPRGQDTPGPTATRAPGRSTPTRSPPTQGLLGSLGWGRWCHETMVHSAAVLVLGRMLTPALPGLQPSPPGGIGAPAPAPHPLLDGCH